MNINTISLNLPRIVTIKGFKKIKIVRFLWIFVIFSVIFLSSFYIFQTNREISEKYALIKYEKELSTLIKEKEILNINMADSASLNSIISLIESSNRGFIKAEKINHLKIIGGNIVSI